MRRKNKKEKAPVGKFIYIQLYEINIGVDRYNRKNRTKWKIV